MSIFASSLIFFVFTLEISRSFKCLNNYDFYRNTISKLDNSIIFLSTRAIENDVRSEDSSKMIGRPHTEESRAKISAANKGKTPWNIGKQHSLETRLKIAEKTKLAMLKIKEEKALQLGLTVEQLDELKKLKKIKNKKATNGGLSEAGRKSISDSLKKRWQNPEYRKNYSMITRGNRTHSEETKLRISEAIKQKWKNNEYSDKFNSTLPPEVRLKISNTLKSKWENQEFRDKMIANFEARGSEWKASLSAKIKEKWNDPAYRIAVESGIERRYNSTIEKNYKERSVRDIERNRRNEISAENKRKREINMRKKELMKLNLLNRVKLRVYHNKLQGKRLKELLGSELWFEEKLKRKRETDVMLDDMTLEKILLKEWSLPNEFINMNPSDYDDNQDMNRSNDADLLSKDYDDYNDDYLDDYEDLIEVYDSNGQLIGTYTETEFQKIRNSKK